MPHLSGPPHFRPPHEGHERVDPPYAPGPPPPADPPPADPPPGFTPSESIFGWSWL